MKALAGSEEGRQLLKKIDDYKMEFGNKSMYSHEYIYTTWREDPTPIVEALRGYLLSDYDYEKDVRELREGRDKAIAEMWSLFPKDRSNAGPRETAVCNGAGAEDDTADPGSPFLYGSGNLCAGSPGADGDWPQVGGAGRSEPGR